MDRRSRYVLIGSAVLLVAAVPVVLVLLFTGGSSLRPVTSPTTTTKAAPTRTKAAPTTAAGPSIGQVSALYAAESDGVLAESYDYHNYTGSGSDLAQLEAVSTPAYRQSLAANAKRLGALVVALQATATAKVIGGKVGAYSSTKAVTAVVLTMSTTTRFSAKATTKELVVTITLIRSNGPWLLQSLVAAR